MNPPTPNWAMQATDKLEAHLRLAGYGITAPMRQTFIDVIRKHAPTVPAADKALRLAAALPTGQNCPSENHAVVVAAMDALEGIAAPAPHLSPAHPTVKQAEGVTDTERLDWLEAFYSETAFSGHSTAVLRDFTSAIAQHGYRKAIDAALRSASQPGGTEG